MKKLEQDANKIMSQAESLTHEMYPVPGPYAKIKDEIMDLLSKGKQVLATVEHLISEVRLRV